MRFFKFNGAVVKKTRTTKPASMPTIYLNPHEVLEVGEIVLSKVPTEAKTFIRTRDTLYHAMEPLAEILETLETF